MQIDELAIKEVCAFAHATAKFLTDNATAFQQFAKYMYNEREGNDWSTLTPSEQIEIREMQIRGLASALHYSDAIRHIIVFDPPPSSFNPFNMGPIRMQVQEVPQPETPDPTMPGNGHPYTPADPRNPSSGGCVCGLAWEDHPS